MSGGRDLVELGRSVTKEGREDACTSSLKLKRSFWVRNLESGIFTDPELTAIGEKYGKTAAQVALKWNAQRDVSIIPKSVHVERMEQNLDIWDFSLTEDEMKTIAARDLGHSEIVDLADPAFVKFIHNYR